MILSNTEIQKAINEGRLRILPEPQDADYDTTAVNLHLGAALAIPQAGSFNYDLKSREGFAQFLARNSDPKQITEDGYVLKPKVFVLGITQEKITLPLIPGQSLAARIEGKSSKFNSLNCGFD